MIRSRFVRTSAMLVAVGTTALATSVAHAVRTPPAHAFFHAALIKAEPAKNDTVAASPAAIKLWFSESVQAAATSIRVTGPASHMVSIGAVTIAAAEKSPAVFPVKEALKPGKYTVAWKAMATDGHPSSGTFAFVVKAAAMKTTK